jgi:hypothetical protein
VTGIHTRRRLRFESFDDVLDDAERLVASANTTTLGKWPLDVLLGHLAVGVDSSIDGIPGKAPWLIRVGGRFIKRRVLSHGMSPGFKLPKKLEAVAFPSYGSPTAAFLKLRRAIERTKAETMQACHPVFGQLTHDEWRQFHLRHAELHLSFALAECTPSPGR